MSIFSKVQGTNPRSNTFDLSHERKFSLSMGVITPILKMPLVPGDKINLATSQLLRFAPLIAPVMHQISVYTHFFFVPNRISWANWENFITGGEDGLAAPPFPTITLDGTNGSLADYLGVPKNQGGANTFAVNALPFAAYQRIYNEYYRDENLQTSATEKANPVLTDGSNNANTTLVTLRNRSWQHDFFTSALPWTQKGVQATIPLGTTAPVKIDTTQALPWLQNVKFSATGASVGATNVSTQAAGNLAVGTAGAGGQVYLDPLNSMVADLSTATAASINDLRRAFKLQEWLEKNARGGSRYIESILSHFGVRSSDSRLQRPEFLGGGSTPVTISEVLQTSTATTQPTPQGNMAGHGISVGANKGISYFAEEHGYIIGVMTVMPKSAYQQGLELDWTKFDKFDYFWPSFAHLGEQPVYNREVYLDTVDGQNSNVFGYTPRYAEYKYINSSVHGDFRTTLDIWHLGRKFATRPLLNAAFIKMVPAQTDRIFAVAATQQLYCHTYNRIKAKRLMPYFGTPKF